MCLVSLATFSVLKSPRASDFIDKIVNKEYIIDREANDSYGTRVLIWDASISLIKSNYLYGLGPSSVYDELKNTYKEKRYVVPFRERLNSHNQFLQITLETGLLGLLLFMYALFNIVLSQKYELKFLAYYIFLIFLINACFESILNRYSGIICFCFIYCIVTILNKKPYKEI